MNWAFYLHPYEVAIAVVNGIDKAKSLFKNPKFKNSKNKNYNSIESLSDKLVDETKRKEIFKNLENAFKVPYAVETYSTKYASGLNYLVCKCYGLGGRPNAVLLLDNNKSAALLQIKNNIDENIDKVAILQATGLNLIMQCNKKEIANKFKNLQKSLQNKIEIKDVLPEVYFFDPNNCAIKKENISNKKEVFIEHAEKLRYSIARD